MANKEEFVRACECGTTIKCSSLDPLEYDLLEEWWQLNHKQHEEVTCREASEIRDAEWKRRRSMTAVTPGMSNKTRAARMRVATWIVEERKQYADVKHELGGENNEIIAAGLLEIPILGWEDSSWKNDNPAYLSLCNYLDRVKLFGPTTPQGIQALGKLTVTCIHYMEMLEEALRILPKPGVPSGEILPNE